MASTKEKLKDILLETPYLEIMYSIDEAVDYLVDNGVTIVDIPTADVVEVKHGEWQKETDDFDWEYIKCSVCGEELYPPDNDDTFDILPKHCQTCGAKMDGGTKA